MAPTIAALSFWSGAEPDEKAKAPMVTEETESEDDYGYATTGVALSEVVATRALPAPSPVPAPAVAPEESMAPQRTPARRGSAGFPRWMRETDGLAEEFAGRDESGAQAQSQSELDDSIERQAGQASERPVSNSGNSKHDAHAQPAQRGRDFPSWIGEKLDAPEAVVEAATEPMRDASPSRWFALRDALDQTAHARGAAAPDAPQVPPIVALFSVSGGVGKTMLAASLTRILAAEGERVLLLDMTPQEILPLYFGARGTTEEPLRVFAPPAGTSNMPVHLFRASRSLPAAERVATDLQKEIVQRAQGFNRLIADLPTSDANAANDLAALGAIFVVPVTPDMHSVASLRLIRDVMAAALTGDRGSPTVFYLLTQFDPGQTLHRDIRDLFARELGDQLLPFSIQRSAQVSEALAQAMTPLDYAPADGVARDLQRLAAWLRSTSASVAAERTPSRWHER